MSLNEYVLGPRSVQRKVVAERLADGAMTEIDRRYYQRTSLMYRGLPVYRTT